MMQLHTPRKTREELERFHARHVESHDSPSRRKFELEFGLPSPEPNSPRKRQLSPRKKYTGPIIETTSQYSFPQYDPKMTPRSFVPETKFNYRKAPDHEYNETMFLLWSVHGKPKV